MSKADERWVFTPAQEAELCLDDAAEAVPFNAYLALALQLPLLLHQHGLGQTLAFLQMRGGGRSDNPHHRALEHLMHWVAMTVGLPEEEVLTSLTRSDSDLYLRATQEARRLLLALRAAAEEELALQQADEAAQEGG